ncbi:MAG TPA: MCE family protein, partial [Acidimicrobiales bacterium]
ARSRTVVKRRVLINMLVVLIMSGLLVAYGVVTLFGNPFEKRRHVSTVLQDSAGLRDGFSASLDGVVVGTVTGVKLVPHGVKVTVALDPGQKLPGDVEAKVVRASAVGEQRLDFEPTHGGTAPALPDGAVVKAARDAIPPDVADVLDVATRLVDAIPAKDLNTVIHEAAVGVRGQAGNLRSIVSSLSTVSDDTVASEHDLRRLLQASPSVLDDLAAMSPQVHQALADTNDLTSILADDSHDLVHLLGTGSDLAVVGDRVVRDNRTNLTCLFSDVKDTVNFLQGSNLQHLSTGLSINQNLFGAIDAIAPKGHAADIGWGGGERNDQTWLRTHLLIPPASPAASAYSPPRSAPVTKYGKACTNVYGTGVAATRPSGTDGTAAGHGAAAAATAASIAATKGSSPAGVTLPTVPASASRQASPASPANSGTAPLLVLGVGAILALLALGSGTRHRRRS